LVAAGRRHFAQVSTTDPEGISVTSSERLSVAARKQLLDELVRKYPDAYISALRLNGIPIPIPDGIDVPRQNPADGRRAFFELIVPDDIWPAMAAWDRGRDTGAATVRLRLASDPDHYVEVHVVDLTEEHGVYLEIVLTEDGSNPWPEKAPAANARARVATMRKDSQSIVLSIDDATTDLLGWTPEQMIGRRTLEFTDPDHLTVAITTYVDMLRNPGCSRRSRVRYRRADGSWLWVEVTNHNLLADPDHGYVLAEVVDVSEEMAYQEALRSREELLRRLTDALPLGVLHVDLDGRVLYRNEQLGSILGHAEAATMREQFASATPEHQVLLEQLLTDVQDDASDADVDIVVGQGGDVRHCRLSLRTLKDAAGAATGAVIAVADVTESRRLREQLERRATTDSLTGCHSRASIMTLLETALAAGKEKGVGTGVVFIDLDLFKRVNDEYGHAVGDEFLVEVSRRLLDAVRKRDAVGRLGGDEFLVLCEGITSSELLSEVARRLSAALEADAVVSGLRLPIQASIGVAWSQHSNTQPDDLVALADDAMYAVKRARPNASEQTMRCDLSPVVRAS
jgi:diguanylate cyclase (GGDEF)-like protein/PAS domain S-box-containing protein